MLLSTKRKLNVYAITVSRISWCVCDNADYFVLYHNVCDIKPSHQCFHL